MTATTNGKIDFAGLRATELSSLWPALPPVLAFVRAGSSDRGPKVGAGILGFSTALSMFWGAAVTLLIVAFYSPASFVLSQWAERAIARPPDRAGWLDARECLNRHGLSIAPTQQLP